MKLFRQIIGAKSAPESREDRLARLAKLPAAQKAAIITSDEEELAIRLALIDQQDFGELLIDASSKSLLPAELEKAARQAIGRMVAEKSVSKEQVLSKIEDVNTLLVIARYSGDKSFESEVFDTVHDQATLAQLCREANAAPVRQVLAQRITEAEFLRELAKLFKKQDKNAYKIIKTKLDAQREIEREHLAAQDLIHTLVEGFRQHADRGFDKDYSARYRQLQRRWQEVALQAEQTAKESISESETACEQKIAAQEAELKAAEAQQQALSHVNENRHKLLQQMWQTLGQAYAFRKEDEQGLEEIRLTLDAAKQQWAEYAQLAKPQENHARDYALINEALAILLTEYAQRDTFVTLYERVSSGQNTGTEQQTDIKHLRGLLYPIRALTHFEYCDIVVSAFDLLKRIDAEQQAQHEQRQKNIHAVGGMLKKALVSVDQGKLKQALGIRHSIDEKLKHLEDLPPYMARQLEVLEESVQKLVDWQAYAVVPKKESLIAAMEKLVDSNSPPEALATKIKNLQDEWKALHQSGKNRNEELWQKFSDLADKAYEPCKAYYAELNEQRKLNLDKRKQLVAQLTGFYNEYDWGNAEWKHVETIMRSARQELHSYVPVERSANKNVIREFDAVLDLIAEKLKAEYEKNKAAKEQLILQAEKLDTVKDMQQAIDSAKRLQSQWKTIGHCHYRDSQKLWKNFRKHCDTVFARKEKMENERRAATDERITAARALVEALQTLLEKDGDELLGARSERGQLQQTITDVEDLPEKVQRAIARDFAQLADKFDRKVEKILQEKARAAGNSFFKPANNSIT